MPKNERTMSTPAPPRKTMKRPHSLPVPGPSKPTVSKDGYFFSMFYVCTFLLFRNDCPYQLQLKNVRLMLRDLARLSEMKMRSRWNRCPGLITRWKIRYDSTRVWKQTESLLRCAEWKGNYFLSTLFINNSSFFLIYRMSLLSALFLNVFFFSLFLI